MNEGAPSGKIIVHEAADGAVRVDVRLERHGLVDSRPDERSVITKHVRNAFRDGELDPEATCAKFAQVQAEGAGTAA